MLKKRRARKISNRNFQCERVEHLHPEKRFGHSEVTPNANTSTCDKESGLLLKDFDSFVVSLERECKEYIQIRNADITFCSLKS